MFKTLALVKSILFFTCFKACIVVGNALSYFSKLESICINGFDISSFHDKFSHINLLFFLFLYASFHSIFTCMVLCHFTCKLGAYFGEI